MALPVEWSQRLRLPLLVAPMLHISSPELVAQACLAGAMAAFPTANCANTTELSAWIVRIRSLLTSSTQTGGYPPAPFAANLIIKSPHVQAHLDCLVDEGIELVITSVGSPRDVIGPLHRAGCRVFADVASVAHAHKALNDGVDGLVLLSAGAGGQTGWANGFAFVRAVRDFYDGPVALAGGLGDGASLWAAQALGADLGYMGTRFIATQEAPVHEKVKQAIVDASELDTRLVMRPLRNTERVLRNAAVDRLLEKERALGANLKFEDIIDEVAGVYPRIMLEGDMEAGAWSCGMVAGLIHDIPTVKELIDRIMREAEGIIYRRLAGLGHS